MTRILGIDPGSRLTGYGIVVLERGQAQHLDHGCIRAGEGDLPARLRVIFVGLSALIARWQPDEIAIEKVFVNRNVDSALKLGQARGAAIVAGATADLPVHEYTPTQIKKAIVGRGGAAKEQVQHMVKILLGLTGRMSIDASDALGVALCHAHTRDSLARMRLAAGSGAGRQR